MASSQDAERRRLPPSWMDKDFFQKALRNEDNDHTISVLKFHIRMANAVGDNYMSDMYRVCVDFQRGSSDVESRSLIVKCQPTIGSKEHLEAMSKMFSKEAHMFTQVLPQLFRLLDEAAPGKHKAFGAKCLLFGVEPTLFLVLEDLSPLGFKLADRRQGLGLAQCRKVMQSIARFHAASVVCKIKHPSLMGTYERNPYHVNGIMGYLFRGALRVLAGEVERWPEVDQTYPERLLKLSETIASKLVQVHEFNEAEFSVLTHGDLWVNNVLFDEDDQVIFVDFQVVHITSPAIDLLYFMHTSLTEDVYSNHRDELLQDYHNELSDTLHLLGYDDKYLSLDKLKQMMEQKAINALFALTTVLPLVLADSSDAIDMSNVLSKTDGTPPSDVGRYSNPSYVNAAKKILPLLAQKELF